VVLFIALGLVSALAWARLAAPDIALVEAAVGAGLTGALLLNTLGWIHPKQRAVTLSRDRRIFHALLVLGLVGGIGASILQLPEHPGLAAAVHERLAESGVGHPVTAVLLNFRGYDTLLEIAVLLVAALAARLHAPPSTSPADDPLGPLIAVLARLLVPGTVLVAGHLVWRGADAPGGAFQAAAVLGGGGILLILARTIRAPRMSSLLVRGVLVIGFACFLAVAGAPLVVGRSLLEYPPAWAKGLIFSVELALTLSIALVLVMFFPGEPPSGRSSAREQLEDRW
jgi:multisubunit Na+/H+ antiporter MnhB subunit